MELRNRNVWITGASSGIGEALAIGLAAAGARLILSARRESRLEGVRDRCRSLGVSATSLPLDLEDTASLPEVARRAGELDGPIDILINNAGIGQSSLALETDLTVSERIMRINYLGTVALSKAVLPAMIARREGQLVVVTSLLGKFGVKRRSSYSASKHALHGYFDSLRCELLNTNVNVTLVCPGWVDTELEARALQGDGSLRGPTETGKDGLTPMAFAGPALKAIRQGKPEVYIGGPEVRGVWAKRFAPALLNRVLARTAID